MSVMVIGKESLERLGKFLSVSMDGKKALKKVQQYHDLNVQNFARTYDEEPLKYQDFEINHQPLVAPEQALKTLDSLYYNCCDYGDEINKEVLVDIKGRVEKVRKSYRINKSLYEHSTWG